MRSSGASAGCVLFDYDDLLIRLQAALTDPTHGPSVCDRLRARYRIVLVDEFQDTDPVQWDILRIPFHGHRTLVLIGDPKQAIYAFRGADVHAYLDAREAAATIRTLPTSFRSDAGLLDGLAAVFRGAALGDERIRVVPVDADHDGPMVQVAGCPTPVRLRVLRRDGFVQSTTKLMATDAARAAVAEDLAAEVVNLLTTATVVPRDGAPTRPVVPGDIAVLVRMNKEATLIGEQLRQAGVPVVLTGRTSVFATPAADEWVLLLEALEQPHRTTVVRRFALGCFVGRTAADLAERGDQDAEDLALQLRVWARVFEQRGLAALFEAVSITHALQRRLLGQHDGERLLTDLRHLAQVLHQETLEGQLGLSALAAWLRRRRDEAATEGEPERSRRLESDAAAVQVITVHTSKGLEFPVVMVPFGWSRWTGKEPTTAVVP
jgi:exodeoxyribonuclease V beta subunit